MKTLALSLTGKEKELSTKIKKTLRVLSFDCLNTQIDFFQQGSQEHDLIVLIEPWEYLCALKHHKKKVCLMLLAIRRFAAELKEQGWHVCLFSIDQEKKKNKNFTEQAFKVLREQFTFEEICVLSPSDFSVESLYKRELEKFSQPITWQENPLFLMKIEEFESWARGRKELTMEYFYRLARKKYNILMEEGKPIGGQWNFDKDNRKPPPSKIAYIEPFKQEPPAQIREVINLIKELFADYYGSIEDFSFATSRQEALAALKYFITKHLGNFGSYQDIMVTDNPWLYHAHLSFYLNLGLITPLECVQAALKAYETSNSPLNSVEGFIRQIIGWREYIRGLYFYQGPEYEKKNYLNAKKSLPEFFWNNKTSLHCLQQSFSQTYQYAYAHHIQRLMIIGNFSLLVGLDPQEVNDWFGLVYADAYPWVHTPNVLGMSLFADGGLLATKPYCSSGSYINKMSNYCSSCQFNVKEKVGPKACPFNSLYWYFLFKHQKTFEKNQRMRMIYATAQKMSPEKKKEIIAQAESFIKSL